MFFIGIPRWKFTKSSSCFSLIFNLFYFWLVFSQSHPTYQLLRVQKEWISKWKLDLKYHRISYCLLKFIVYESHQHFQFKPILNRFLRFQTVTEEKYIKDPLNHFKGRSIKILASLYYFLRWWQSYFMNEAENRVHVFM